MSITLTYLSVVVVGPSVMRYDYVVGGGIYGAGTAWELAAQGAEVGLFEAETIAIGASGGLGKRGIRANGRDSQELPLMELAYDLWPDLSDEIGDPDRLRTNRPPHALRTGIGQARRRVRECLLTTVARREEGSTDGTPRR